MTNAQTYRERAKKYLQMARQSEGERRKSLLELASLWHDQALELEANQQPAETPPPQAPAAEPQQRSVQQQQQIQPDQKKK